MAHLTLSLTVKLCDQVTITCCAKPYWWYALVTTGSESCLFLQDPTRLNMSRLSLYKDCKINKCNILYISLNVSYSIVFMALGWKGVKRETEHCTLWHIWKNMLGKSMGRVHSTDKMCRSGKTIIWQLKKSVEKKSVADDTSGCSSSSKTRDNTLVS